MNSKLKPSHLASGVAVLVVLVPIVALTQVDLGRDPGPVMRIKLSEPKPFAPEEAMVSPVGQHTDEVVRGLTAEEPGVIEGAEAPGLSSVSSLSRSRQDSRAAPRRISSSSQSGAPDEAQRTEVSPLVPTMRSDEYEPVATPRPRPSEIIRRVEPLPMVTPVSPVQRTSEDLQNEEQASREDVSPTAAAREALRDVRPR